MVHQTAKMPSSAFFRLLIATNPLPSRKTQKPQLDTSLSGLCQRPSFERARNALSGSIYPVCLMVR